MALGMAMSLIYAQTTLRAQSQSPTAFSDATGIARIRPVDVPPLARLHGKTELALDVDVARARSFAPIDDLLDPHPLGHALAERQRAHPLAYLLALLNLIVQPLHLEERHAYLCQHFQRHFVFFFFYENASLTLRVNVSLQSAKKNKRGETFFFFSRAGWPEVVTLIRVTKF